MRESLLPLLRCPSCGSVGGWDLAIDDRDLREVRTGWITCRTCRENRSVTHGIVDLLHHPPDYVRHEAAGLGRFADRMRDDGWDRERITQLPYVSGLGYWYNQALAMEQVLGSRDIGVDLSPGRRILDVGANTCWASAVFATRGMEVVALDIAEHEMQGLRTADWWFDEKDIFFERVLSTMFAPALASESFDLIWCCEVLHHNHRSNLRRTMRELFRVLKPGGRLIVVNEPVRAARSPKARTSAEVAAYHGHEHAFLRGTYVRAARDAGFRTRVIGPWRINLFLHEDGLTISRRMSSLAGVKVALGHVIRRHRRLQGAFLSWKTDVDGMSLFMVAAKPDRAEPSNPTHEDHPTASSGSGGA